MGEPLSATRTVTVLVLGPWASVGIQVITPLLELMVIPAGAETRPNVSVFAGISASVAVLVANSVRNSAMVRLPGTVNTGATFTSRTITVKLLVALRLGAPATAARVV